MEATAWRPGQSFDLVQRSNCTRLKRRRPVRCVCTHFKKRRRPVRCVHQDPEPVRLKCVGHVVSGHPLISVDRVRLAAITSRTMTEGSGYFPTVETRVRRRVDGVENVRRRVDGVAKEAPRNLISTPSQTWPRS